MAYRCMDGKDCGGLRRSNTRRARPHALHADSLQLCAQAICLEEMLVCEIPEAFLYYGDPRRRMKIVLDEALRGEVKQIVGEMRALYDRRHTPHVKRKKECASCSLAGICLPSLDRSPAAAGYLLSRVKEKDDAETV